MAVGYIDPLAQTFFVDPATYPKGMYVHSVDLIFRKKDQVTFLPFTVQLRPTVNGFPHASLIHSSAALGQVSLKPDKINTVTGVGSDIPNINNPAHYTRFQFPAPIYLPTGEHAIVMFTNSDDYEVFIAEIGGTRLDGSDRRVDKQPYTGSFFKSQNGSTYTPYQDTDLVFRVNACEFTVGDTFLFADNLVPSSNLEYDLIKLSSQDLIFEQTELDYSYKSTSNATGILDSSYSRIFNQENIFLNERKIVYSTANNSLLVKVDFSTQDNTVSSMVDTSRLNITTVKNIINDCGLSSNVFSIINGGTGYTTNATITVTGTKGIGAEVVGVANATSGQIESIVVTNSGTGYTEDISLSISGGGGTGAVVSVESETSSKGGPALARYITRKVNLSDGFDANMIRVYLTAYQPQQSTVEVYYKILAEEDPTNFNDRPYVRMLNVQQGNESKLNEIKSRVETDYLEYLFVPSTEDTSYIGTDDVLYNNFKTFAIKIVMRTSDTTQVPIIRDMRAIALAP